MDRPDVERAVESKRADEHREPENGQPGSGLPGNGQPESGLAENGEAGVEGWFQSIQPRSWFQPKAAEQPDNGDAPVSGELPASNPAAPASNNLAPPAGTHAPSPGNPAKKSPPYRPRKSLTAFSSKKRKIRNSNACLCPCREECPEQAEAKTTTNSTQR